MTATETPMQSVRRGYEESKRHAEANTLIRTVENMNDIELARLRAALNGEAPVTTPRRAQSD